MDWCVTIHTVGAEVTGDEAEAVVDLLFDVRGVVIHGARGELGVTVTVAATSCKGAIEQVTARLDDACDAADLGARKIVEVCAVEWSRFKVEVEHPPVVEHSCIQAPSRAAASLPDRLKTMRMNAAGTAGTCDDCGPSNVRVR